MASQLLIYENNYISEIKTSDFQSFVNSIDFSTLMKKTTTTTKIPCQSSKNSYTDKFM